ncbi:MAG: hypothetical protein IT375_05400 [Polyangiaceae bacterium]|nr:hypothetical protein [Polyangiaceae bacterium]
MSAVDLVFAALTLALFAAAALASRRYGATNPRLKTAAVVMGFALGAAYFVSAEAGDAEDEVHDAAEP